MQLRLIATLLVVTGFPTFLRADLITVISAGSTAESVVAGVVKSSNSSSNPFPDPAGLVTSAYGYGGHGSASAVSIEVFSSSTALQVEFHVSSYLSIDGLYQDGFANGVFGTQFTANATLNFSLFHSGPSDVSNLQSVTLHDDTTNQYLYNQIGGTGIFYGTLTSGDTYYFQDYSIMYNNGTYADTFNYSDLTLTSATVPEPSTLAMLGLGGIGLAVSRFRKRRIEPAV